MSAIFGSVEFGDRQLPVERVSEFCGAMAKWGPDGVFTWKNQHAVFGQALLHNSPEAQYEVLPLWLADQGLLFTGEARLDNRDDLFAALNISQSSSTTTSDGDLLLRAYLKWGEFCPARLIGDWSFGAWHSAEKRLFLARDHHGNTALYFHRDTGNNNFSFSSSAKGLHAIGIPQRLNELVLAQALTSWFPDQGLQTIDLDIQRLPPAHALEIKPTGMRVWRYWYPDQTPELKLRGLPDYFEGFLDVYGKAVRSRCRSLKPIGVTLSGGLDSGSVAVLASSALAESNRRLAAFTHAPLTDATPVWGHLGIPDETRLARATSGNLPNVDHQFLTAANITPVQGIKLSLAAIGRPTHAASNAFWISDLLQTAQRQGIGTLLTGQGGNATISWTGAPGYGSLTTAIVQMGWKEGLRRVLPISLLRGLAGWRARQPDWSHTAINPDFAKRLDLAGLRAQGIGRDPAMPQAWRSPRDVRNALLQPGYSTVGEYWAPNGAAHGMEVRDPTLDPRVIAYTLSVPDQFFADPHGLDRLLIREAMKGRLPEAVRVNRLLGVQASDLAIRLRSSADEVDAALNSLAKGPAGEYLNLDSMNAAWVAVRDRPSIHSTHRAGTILLRGLMAGLWLNRGVAFPDDQYGN